MNYWLVDCSRSRSRHFHLYGYITIASDGLQNLGLCWALPAFKREWIFIVQHLLWKWASFLAHLSWKLKWAFLSPVFRRHSVRLSLCLSVRPSVNFYIFDFFSRTTWPILTRLGTNHLWVEGIQVSSNEVDNPCSGGDNSKRVKIHWTFFKICFFFRTSRPNSIKLGTNYPWVKGI
jgi:hypothetical protein